MEVIKSTRGKPKLLYQGYAYVVDRKYDYKVDISLFQSDVRDIIGFYYFNGMIETLFGFYY